MDPVTLSATATTLIVLFLTKSLEKAGENFGDSLSKQASLVWTKVRNKFSGKPISETVANEIENNPDDKNNQETLKLQLKQLFESDADFKKEIEELLDDKTSDNLKTVLNLGSGAVATDQGVASGSGGIAIRGNVSGGITVDNNDKDSK